MNLPLSFEPITNGPMTGVLTFKILVKEPITDPDIELYLAALEKNPFSKKYRLVTLEGEGIDHPLNEVLLYKLTTELKKRKYNLRVVTTGKVFHQWFNKVDWVRVEMGVEPIYILAANELIYRMELDTSPEPDLPPDFMVNLYILAGPAVTEKGLFKFLATSKRPWAIALGAKRSFIQEATYDEPRSDS